MISDLSSFLMQADPTNYTKGRTKKVRKITLHHMASKLTAYQCGSIFQNSTRNASSNYGIGYDGVIGCYVRESDTPWTDSNWNSNCESITIECSNSSIGGDYPISDFTLNSLIELVADIAKRYNITLIKGETLTWHRMYANTNCPGEYILSKLDYIIEQANKIIFENVSNNITQLKSNESVADEVILGLWGNGEERKLRLTQSGYNYEEVRSIVNSRYGIGQANSNTGQANSNTGQANSNTGQKVMLPSGATSWRVYPLNKAPVKGNEIGYLRPFKFGGLTYNILYYTKNNVAVIDTKDFGRVQIYVHPSTGAKIV